MCPVERLNRESNVTKSVINVILVRLYFRYERRLVSGQSINRIYESDARKKKKKIRVSVHFLFIQSFYPRHALKRSQIYPLTK